MESMIKDVILETGKLMKMLFEILAITLKEISFYQPVLMELLNFERFYQYNKTSKLFRIKDKEST